MKDNNATATFAAGCFWSVQQTFDALDGVLETVAGYTGGHTTNPTYEAVCSHSTGHAEAVKVTYDPHKISYLKLLNIFFEIHDPTTLNRQGPDIGDQYRSAIFYHSAEQRRIAEELKEDLDNSGDYDEPIVTEIVPAQPFYPAEDYHQHYNKKHGIAGCHL